MLREAHQSVVLRANSQLVRKFPQKPLCNGAVYPDGDEEEKRKSIGSLPLSVGNVYEDEPKGGRAYERHHGLSRSELDSKLNPLLQRARDHWIEGRQEESAFLFGVMTHFLADTLVPSYAEDSEPAKRVQKDLQESVNRFVPRPVERPELGTEPEAKKALEDFLSKVTGGHEGSSDTDGASIVDQLNMLHRCLVVTGNCITEEAEPQVFREQFKTKERAAKSRLTGLLKRLSEECENQYQPSIAQSMQRAESRATSFYRGWRNLTGLAKCWVVSHRYPDDLVNICEEASESFRETFRTSTKYERYGVSVERSCAEYDFKRLYNSTWFSVDAQVFERQLASLGENFTREGSSLVKRFEDSAKRELAGIQQRVLDRELERFRNEWPRSLRYKVVVGGGEVWVNLIMPLFVALALLLLWFPIGALSLLVVALGWVAIFILRALMKRVIDRWRKLTEYAETGSLIPHNS